MTTGSNALCQEVESILLLSAPEHLIPQKNRFNVGLGVCVDKLTMADSKSAVNVGVKMSYNHNFAPAK